MVDQIELGIAHIAYATSFRFENGSLHVRRITRRGFETVSPLDYPCSITVAQWTQPPFATFARTRWARSQPLHRWTAADIDADEARIGLAGSRTNVVKVFSPREAGARQLILTHLSRRYPDHVVLQEARRIFPDTRVARDLDRFRVQRAQ